MQKGIDMLNKFEDIAGKLKADIQSGKYSTKIPSEQTLAQAYKTTHVTAAKALNLLRGDNVIIREQGKGSFVNPDFIKGKELILDFHSNDVYLKALSALKTSHPALRVSKGNGLTKAERLIKNDLTIQVSKFPGSYEKYFSPLSSKFVREASKSQKYYAAAFTIHQGDSLYYGLPFIFSPFVLIYNKTLLRKLGYDSIPANLCYADLVKYESELKKEKKFLFSCEKFRFSTVMSYIFPASHSHEENSETPVTTDAATISNGLKKMESVFRSGISSGIDFKSGNALFSYTCRQGIWNFQKHEVGFEWDLCPLPEGVGGFRTLASESVFVSANSTGKDFLHELAEYFLSSEMQTIFSKRKYGIPVLKSATIDSLESSDYRDDFFFTEIKKSCFNYSFLSNNLLGSFMLMTDKYFNNQISFEQYHKGTLELFHFDELSKKNATEAVELIIS
jgi:DNA-binding transcriptional regulator YhcF (GntR family)